MADVAAKIEDYKFNEAANASYDFVWGTYCDWYLELAKPVLQGEDAAGKAETQATAAYVLDQILRCCTRSCRSSPKSSGAETGKAGPAREKLLILSEWPQLDGLADPRADAEMEWLIDVVSGIRSVRTEMNVPAGAKIKLIIVGAGEETGIRTESQLQSLLRLARLEDVAYGTEVPTSSAQLVIGEATFVLPLAGVIDIDAERVRLKREIAKEEVEIDKIDKKLGNEQFVAKAKPEVIEEQHQRRAEAVARRERLAGRPGPAELTWPKMPSGQQPSARRSRTG